MVSNLTSIVATLDRQWWAFRRSNHLIATRLAEFAFNARLMVGCKGVLGKGEGLSSVITTP